MWPCKYTGCKLLTFNTNRAATCLHRRENQNHGMIIWHIRPAPVPRFTSTPKKTSFLPKIPLMLPSSIATYRDSNSKRARIAHQLSRGYNLSVTRYSNTRSKNEISMLHSGNCDTQICTEYIFLIDTDLYYPPEVVAFSNYILTRIYRIMNRILPQVIHQMNKGRD